ncbi:MAG: metalloregulator ArsR/SmtB family transcription factor [Candidatus Obscuribacterales bacterium]|nr:metalloregulator ArsR/SmtB family transcription factor [Steroidobacteraceae bacterium]
MAQSFPIVVNALRAAAEPTRFRLLALLRLGELTVGEICAVLGQSQPRISRHLKLLCDAGLLVRFREEHWVYYRVPLTGSGHELVAQLSELIATEDPVLQLDHRRMNKVLAERVTQVSRTATGASNATDMNAALAELDTVLLAELGKTPLGELLDIATGSGRMLRTLGPHAAHAVGIDISTEALRFARKQTYGAGLGHCVFRRGDMYELPFEDAAFDTVTLERVLVAAERVEDVLKEAARALRPTGRLCVVEDFELLAELVGKNPLAVLREWFERAGLTCERLRPVDTHGVHLIVALARKPAQLLANAA